MLSNVFRRQGNRGFPENREAILSATLPISPTICYTLKAWVCSSMVEQWTLNPLVEGSSPSGPTTDLRTYTEHVIIII